MADERVIPLTPADPDPNAQKPLGGGSDITFDPPKDNPDETVNIGKDMEDDDGVEVGKDIEV